MNVDQFAFETSPDTSKGDISHINQHSFMGVDVSSGYAHPTRAELYKRRAEVELQISQIEKSMRPRKPHANIGKPSPFSKLEQAKHARIFISAGMGLAAACERVGISKAAYLKHLPSTLVYPQKKAQQARSAHAKILGGMGVVKACKESGLTTPIYYKYRNRGLFSA